MSEPAENFNPAEPVAPAAPKPKRGRRRAAPRAKAKVVPFKAPDEFAGMTKLDCCTACKPDRCVISGSNYCAHPFMSGLQSITDPQIVARFGRAKASLAHQRIDLEKDIV